MTEQELDKACEWLRKYLPMMYEGTKEIDEDFIYIFRKAMDAVVEDSSTPRLTWQDMARISDIIGHTARLTKDGSTRNPEEFFTEVLRRFKEERK